VTILAAFKGDLLNKFTAGL